MPLCEGAELAAGSGAHGVVRLAAEVGRLCPGVDPVITGSALSAMSEGHLLASRRHV